MTVCALILASKFYCETEDLYVNSDIARLLASNGKFDAEKLNTMEVALADLLDYKLFVSQTEYNEDA